MTQRSIGLALLIGVTLVPVTGCAKPNSVRAGRMGAPNTGPGSTTAERKAFEGTWTLASLEIVNEQGTMRPVKASGQLSYDAYSNMTVRGVIEDPEARAPIVLNFEGRIFIDPVKHEFYPADMKTDRPVEPSDIRAIAPEKVRRYELSPDSLIVTYLDAAAKPSAIARWKRP
ncbi:MAG TPA: hypothetical protein VKH34_04050 [Vicinamibacterales bacterium]|nr:hypothetical protein [Vicinamibacterales bacterium]